jgi:hypothetical protein
VPRRDVAGRCLGQERLVRHVRLGVDDDDLGPARGKLLRQAQSGVQPYVTCPYDNDSLRFHALIISLGRSFRRVV